MRILPLCLALLAFPAAAEIYSYVDAQGNRVFTDQPQGGALTVTAASAPGLYPGHRYRLRLDGAAAGPDGLQAVFALNGLERGSHRLVVEILDADGRTLEHSPEQAVHLKPPS
ncbi:hypothetical protein GCM10027514_19190 [Azotobacter armeniacus]